MIRLHGFALSNYTNMCKFALLEKGLDFEEVTVMPSQDPEHKKKSPMGKLPVLETENGFIFKCETFTKGSPNKITIGLVS